MSDPFDQSNVTGIVLPHKYGPIVQVGDRQWQLIYNIDRNENRWEELEPGEYALLISDDDAEYARWRLHYERWVREQNERAIQWELEHAAMLKKLIDAPLKPIFLTREDLGLGPEEGS